MSEQKLSVPAIEQIIAGGRRAAEIERQYSEAVLAAAETACAHIGAALRSTRDEFELAD